MFSVLTYSYCLTLRHVQLFISFDVKTASVDQSSRVVGKPTLSSNVLVRHKLMMSIGRPARRVVMTLLGDDICCFVGHSQMAASSLHEPTSRRVRTPPNVLPTYYLCWYQTRNESEICKTWHTRLTVECLPHIMKRFAHAHA